MKEKSESRKSSVTANELMAHVNGQFEKLRLSHGTVDKIINGVWAERTSCTVRNHYTHDGIRVPRLIHYGFADALYEVLKLMQENELTLQDLECNEYPPELAYPTLIFSVHTKEHGYEYYPVLLCSQFHFDSEFDSTEDEYMQIENAVASLSAVYCNLNHKPEENG